MRNDSQSPHFARVLVFTVILCATSTFELKAQTKSYMDKKNEFSFQLPTDAVEVKETERRGVDKEHGVTNLWVFNCRGDESCGSFVIQRFGPKADPEEAEMSYETDAIKELLKN